MIRNNNQQNGRRRGRGGGQGGGGGGMPQRAPGSQNYGNNRLDIRQRGNATQLLDKYKTLARDAAQQGDRVASEYYLQYADHYFRVLNEIRERQPEHQRGPRPGYDADDEDGVGDVGNGYNPAAYAAQVDGNQGSDGDDQRQEYRGQDGRNQDGRNQDGRNQDGRNNDGRDNDTRQPEPRQQDARRDEYRRDEPRRDEPRRERSGNGRAEYRADSRDDGRTEAVRDDEVRGNDRIEPARDEDRGQPRRTNARRDSQRDEAEPESAGDSRMTESEPVPVLAGLPGPATLSPVAAAAGDEEPPRRRRGRPRKVVEEAPADIVEA